MAASGPNRPLPNPTPLDYVHREGRVLPSNIRLGASSWTHEFWKGQIYHRSYRSGQDFNLRSLEEYAQLGLFTCVEIDSTFYTPPKEETLAQYARLTPDGFVFTAKIWERISIPEFPDMKRYGKLAGQVNEAFLSPEVFAEQFLPPFRNPEFHAKLGCFLLQFPRMSGALATSTSFLSRLEHFLAAFPADFKLAIEIRNRELLVPRYLSLLNRYGAAHCFNHWETMPSLIDQMKCVAAAGGSQAAFYMARLLTPLSMRFEEAGRYFEPFHDIKQRNDQARSDVRRLVKRALERDVPAYVIVNNRFEGNTPRTILELEELLLSDTL